MYTPTRVLIWGKTYPELSSRYTETVCTGGVREDGRPIRLYPVPLRYLEGPQQYKLYQWITVPTEKSTSDPRPESFKINPDRIECGEVVPTHGTWETRRDLLSLDRTWHFESMDQLKAAQRETKRSIGIMRVGRVDDVVLVRKPESERTAFEEKMRAISDLVASDMFHPEYRTLEYLPNEIKLRWRCAVPCETCRSKPHSMQVLDWGLLELARRDGWEAAISHLRTISDLSTHDFRLFLGTFRMHMQTFGIIGLWYPKIQLQGTLFGAAMP